MHKLRNNNIRITKKCVINSVSNIIICTFMFNIGFVSNNNCVPFLKYLLLSSKSFSKVLNNDITGEFKRTVSIIHFLK